MRSPNAVLGAILVLVGLSALVLQLTGVRVDLGRIHWPFFVIVPGAVLGAVGVVTTSRGLLVAGTIVTVVGLILLYQDATDHYESWAYIWALIPAAAGLVEGLAAAARGERASTARAFRAAAVFGVVFLVGLGFFEGFIFARRPEADLLVRLGAPLLLIGAGLFVLLRRPGSTRESGR
jgi:hypothetical protein